jgi:hypothetical protein
MRRFAELLPNAEKVPSVMAQISWTAHRILLDRFADEPELYLWYASKAAETVGRCDISAARSTSSSTNAKGRR